MEQQPCPCDGGKGGGMVVDAGKQSPPATAEEDASPASKVFGNGDLAGEILDRVDSPTTLVCAALASRICYRRASDPAFLRRFPARHPLRPLGLYVTGRYCSEFVPMPPAPELTAALRRRAGSVFDAYHPDSCAVYDSRINGRVLFKGAKRVDDRYKLVVSDTLRRAGDGAMRELLLPEDRDASGKCLDALVLLPEDQHAVCYCYRVQADYTDDFDGPSLSVQVSEFMLSQSRGEWEWIARCFNRVGLPRAPERIAPKVVLTGGKRVYMLAEAGYLIRVHVDELGRAKVFTINLPEGVTCNNHNFSLCRSGDDGSALYFIHVMAGKLLTVWLLATDDSEWVLKDTVSVEETCGHLFDGGDSSIISVVGAGDNAEFVFLQHRGSGTVIYLHLGTTRAERVYQTPTKRGRQRNRGIVQVHPFYAVWPPVFPPLAADSDEGEQSRHG